VEFQRRDATGAKTGELTCDLMTFRERAKLTFTDNAGQSHTVDTNERYYAPPERCWLLKTAGFAKVVRNG